LRLVREERKGAAAARPPSSSATLRQPSSDSWRSAHSGLHGAGEGLAVGAERKEAVSHVWLHARAGRVAAVAATKGMARSLPHLSARRDWP
jgi:hypothetical protein